MPGIPYTVNKRGFGPAWTNSLFENNAELALGMFLGSVKQQRAVEKARVEKLSHALTMAGEAEGRCGGMPDAAMSVMKAACEDYLAAFDDFDASRKAAADALVAVHTRLPWQADQQRTGSVRRRCCKFKDQLAKKTFWMFGGDGWAYDIGFGGLDHVLASGENVNVLVVDTEVYSNTGGQCSKATPAGRRGAVRRQRQEDRQEGPGRHRS